MIAAIGIAAPARGADARREYRAAGRFELPVQNLGTPIDPTVVADDLARKAWTDAATRIDLLLRDHPDSLYAPADRRLLSVTAWVQSLPPDQQRALRRQGSLALDPPARRKLDILRQEPGTRPGEFYDLAMRYPFTSAATDALLEAGDRAVRRADPWAAAAFYSLALESDATLDGDRADDFAVARTLCGRTPEHPPASAQARIAQARPDSYTGPLAFDATWWEQPDAINRARCFPRACGGTIYLVSAKHVIAMRDDGNVLWRWNAVDASNRSDPDRHERQSRGTPYAPALISGAGSARILVARQQRPGGKDFCLRAFRATDGKLLWTTEGNPGMAGFSLASDPAAAGGFIYAVGVEFTNESATLMLLALDALTGRIAFKCPLGDMPGMRRQRQPVHGFDAFWEQTAPTVAGDCVFATPNVGCAFAVERFDGKLRWTYTYDQVKDDPYRQRESRAGGTPLPVDPGELLRYRTTPCTFGDSVVIAPQDSADTFCLDRQTGALRWSLPSSPAHTLIGQDQNVAVLAGSALTGIDIPTGHRKWFLTLPAGSSTTGPPALAGGTLYVPLNNARLLTLSPQTGEPVTSGWKHPNWRFITSGETTRKILDEMMVLPAFGAPRDK